MSQRLPSATPTPRPAAAVDEPLLAALSDFALKGSSFKAPLLRKLDERARGTPTPAAAGTPEELYLLFKSIKTVSLREPYFRALSSILSDRVKPAAFLGAAAARIR